MAIFSKIVFGIGLSMSIGVGVLSYLMYSHFKQGQIPTKWKRIGKLAALRLYPIKSGAPLLLHCEKTQINCDPQGLRLGSIRDRGLFLLNEYSLLVSEKCYPKLALITTEVTGLTRITFKAPNMDPIQMDFLTLLNRVTADEYLVNTLMRVGLKFDKWFSRAILDEDSGLRFMYCHDDSPTILNEDLPTKEDHIIGDSSSYLFMNLATLEQISERTHLALNSLSFRTNFDIKMDKNVPFAENNWKWMKIGENAIFRIACHCRKCTQEEYKNESTLDSPQHELIKNSTKCTLAKHMGLRKKGLVQLNDIVYVQD